MDNQPVETVVVTRLLQAFSKWAFPVLLVLITAGIKKLADKYPVLALGLDPDTLAWTVLSVILTIISAAATFLVKRLKVGVGKLQQLLNAKGVDVHVDSYLGPKTLDAVAQAINDPSIRVNRADLLEVAEKVIPPKS